MFSRAALAVFALSAAELVLLSGAVRAWGAAPVAAAVLTSAVLGMLLIRRQLKALFLSGTPAGGGGAAGRASRGPTGFATERGTPGRITDRSLRVLAGVLLVIPGILTSAVGALLTVPPVRAASAGFIRRRVPSPVTLLDASFPANGRSPHRRDVVDVDVVAEDMPTSARSELH